ncbi:MAG TPA: hypothetical protein VF077_12695 [Nitrospiraceae bacterium]
MSETSHPPVSTTLFRALIPLRELHYARGGYEGILMAYHINPFTPYRRIERPELGAVQFIQLAPQGIMHE